MHLVTRPSEGAVEAAWGASFRGASLHWLWFIGSAISEAPYSSDAKKLWMSVCLYVAFAVYLSRYAAFAVYMVRYAASSIHDRYAANTVYMVYIWISE